MKPSRRAVIDVGTNSVKLLVAEVSGHEVLPVWEGSHQTRLGEGFYETHRLQPGPVARTAKAVSEFVGRAHAEGADSIRVVATSAAREALNAEELATALQQACNVRVEIISGEQEAEWAFRGAMSDPELAAQPVLLLDIGGGSTEFILGHGEQVDFRHSFPLGTARLMQKIPHGDPPAPGELATCRSWLRQFMLNSVCPKVAEAMRREARFSPENRELKLVATGGTASILGCMEAKLTCFDRRQLEATVLPLDRLGWHVEHLWSLSLSERQKIVGLPANRADVILTGVAICEAVVEHLGFKELRISTRGLRFAAVMEAPPVEVSGANA